MRAAIYRLADGVITAVAHLDEDILDQQCAEGEGWVEVANNVSDVTHKIEDGVAVLL